MPDPPLDDLLTYTAGAIGRYRATVADQPVGATASIDELRLRLDVPLPEQPRPPRAVLEEMVAAVDGGLVATAGPRYFGFVIGGSTPAALCADLLAAGWDQPAFNAVTSPAAAVVEEVAGRWLADLLGLPPGVSFGFVTGAQAANTVGLAAGRHRVLADRGWDVERQGLGQAPAVRVLAGDERHATVDRALRLLGLGTDALIPVPSGANGALGAEAVAAGLAEDPAAPTIVCTQAGNVNTGACDDLAGICRVAHAAGAWVHVDGAFGLWAAASPGTAHLVEGLAGADSWGCDGHKWLNVPYDSGFAFCASPQDHRAAMSYTAAYLVGQGAEGVRAPGDWVPESSRRARGFAVYAGLAAMGRHGVSDLVDRCCRLARRFATGAGGLPGVEVVNDVVLNQVLLGLDRPELTDQVAAAVQDEGTCWLGTTTWRGRRLIRVSVSSAVTTEDDIDRSVEALGRVWAACATPGRS